MSWEVQQFGKFYTVEGKSINLLQVGSPAGGTVNVEITDKGFQTFLKAFQDSEDVESVDHSYSEEGQIGFDDSMFGGGDPP